MKNTNTTEKQETMELKEIALRKLMAYFALSVEDHFMDKTNIHNAEEWVTKFKNFITSFEQSAVQKARVKWVAEINQRDLKIEAEHKEWILDHDKKLRAEVAKEIQDQVYQCLYDAQWVELATLHNFEAGKLNITYFDEVIKKKYLSPTTQKEGCLCICHCALPKDPNAESSHDKSCNHCKEKSKEPK